MKHICKECKKQLHTYHNPDIPRYGANMDMVLMICPLGHTQYIREITKML